MWTLVLAIFGGFKFLTWWRARAERGSVGRTLAYLLMWPGMDWRTFLKGGGRDGARPSKLFVAGKMIFGAAVFWGVARLVPTSWPIVQGWVGLIGLAFLLHFGAMHALALVWGVKPIMDAPLLARSVNDFWSRRWNTAFPQLAGPLWFEPLKKWFSPAVATTGVFLMSGLLHELAISFPARGGYGLPTAYFLMQGAGVLIERKAVRLNRRPWAWLVVAGPVVILFHPLFLQNVVLPMMRAWRAL
jgi:alginate O-acetyltransferase complex protein AlgI